MKEGFDSPRGRQSAYQQAAAGRSSNSSRIGALRMPYIIETFDREGTLDLRRTVRAAHLEFLEARKSILLACGAKLNDDGSDAGGGVYIVDLETRVEAQAFIQADPFFRAGLFEKVSITRWRKAYLDGTNYLTAARRDDAAGILSPAS